MSGVDVSVIIPTRNEEQTIGEVIKKAKSVLEGLGLSYEIIVADNSEDKTPDIARSLGAVVVVPDRLGYGYAYRYAIKRSRGKVLVLVDGDNTYDLTELPLLLKPVLSGAADFVMCTRLRGRIMKGAMPWLHRYIGNPILTWILNVFYGVGVSDSQCGFRVIRRDAFEKLQLESTGMEFATDMLIKAHTAGLKIVEIPITYYPRAKGSVSKLKSIQDGWRHLEFMIWYSPKSAFYIPGLALFFLGLLLVLLALIRSLSGISPGVHLATLGGVFTMIGVNLVFFGAVLDVNLSRRLRRDLHPLTRFILSVSTLRATTVGFMFLAVGVLYVLYLFFVWVESGFRWMPYKGENIVALLLLFVGSVIAVGSIALSALKRDVAEL